MVNVKRKMLAARDDLVDKISEIASSKGFTLFGMTNNMLELAVKADGMGISLEEAVENYELIKAARDASFTLVLESLLYETAEVACGVEKDKTSKAWLEAGVWFAKQYITRGIEAPFETIGRDLKAFSWNIPELIIEKLDNQVTVRVLSPRFTESYTLLFAHFLEGILETFGYKITYKEVGRGNIRLEASERGS